MTIWTAEIHAYYTWTMTPRRPLLLAGSLFQIARKAYNIMDHLDSTEPFADEITDGAWQWWSEIDDRMPYGPDDDEDREDTEGLVFYGFWYHTEPPELTVDLLKTYLSRTLNVHPNHINITQTLPTYSVEFSSTDDELSKVINVVGIPELVFDGPDFLSPDVAFFDGQAAETLMVIGPENRTEPESDAYRAALENAGWTVIDAPEGEPWTVSPQSA